MPHIRSSSLHLVKGAGYLVSTVSVILLAIVSWHSARENLALALCLLGGAATSVIGMFCRWLSYELEERQKREEDAGRIKAQRVAT